MKRLSTLLMLAILFVASIFAQNREVVITYQGNTASVNISSDIASVVTTTVHGANVSIVQDTAVKDGIHTDEYVLIKGF